LPERAAEVAAAIVDEFGAPALVVEFPGLWGSNPQSQASASRGDTFGLAYACGVLAAAFAAERVHLISPQQWKGQLPKHVVMKRLWRAWGAPAEKLRDHEADAWGMGAAVFGIL
jgi:hypothetical protein